MKTLKSSFKSATEYLYLLMEMFFLLFLSSLTKDESKRPKYRELLVSTRTFFVHSTHKSDQEDEHVF